MHNISHLRTHRPWKYTYNAIYTAQYNLYARIQYYRMSLLSAENERSWPYLFLSRPLNACLGIASEFMLLISNPPLVIRAYAKHIFNILCTVTASQLAIDLFLPNSPPNLKIFMPIFNGVLAAFISFYPIFTKVYKMPCMKILRPSTPAQEVCRLAGSENHAIFLKNAIYTYFRDLRSGLSKVFYRKIIPVLALPFFAGLSIEYITSTQTSHNKLPRTTQLLQPIFRYRKAIFGYIAKAFVLDALFWIKSCNEVDKINFDYSEERINDCYDRLTESSAFMAKEAKTTNSIYRALGYNKEKQHSNARCRLLGSRIGIFFTLYKSCMDFSSSHPSYAFNKLQQELKKKDSPSKIDIRNLVKFASNIGFEKVMRDYYKDGIAAFERNYFKEYNKATSVEILNFTIIATVIDDLFYHVVGAAETRIKNFEADFTAENIRRTLITGEHILYAPKSPEFYKNVIEIARCNKPARL